MIVETFQSNIMGSLHSYKWVRLDEYEGDKLYITLNYKEMHLNYSGEYVEFNGPKPIVAGLYTSSPRKY